MLVYTVDSFSIAKGENQLRVLEEFFGAKKRDDITIEIGKVLDDIRSNNLILKINA